MSMEQMQNPPERTPLGSDAEKFDAKGEPRMTRELPDGSMAWLSQSEYEDAVQAWNEEHSAK